MTVLGLYEFYLTFLPEIELSSRSSPPVPFQITNKNPFFEMYDVQLACDVTDSKFMTPKGPIGYSIPFTSGVTNAAPIIPRGGTAHFNCDASQFTSFKGNQFCIATLCAPLEGIVGSDVYLAAETLNVHMIFRIMGWQRSSKFQSFTWDGRNWSEGPLLK